ncbi:hypothetical protein KAZ93_05215 [Patescibacteria group bacterium]|nr:hypothetical protein [Patescibacteria group bacterium]
MASGHVGGFADALIDDKKTGQRFRADKLIEEYIERKKTETLENKEKIISKYTDQMKDMVDNDSVI